eukprot:TRINITY_DN17899_c0_g1_i1.p1 TRINITY_DN17899_c0_g1~~TRINITY_DN17899_c0_g1_i1.p1  ORF type:complete len:484 (-),score=60.38 TRINITY_DN17899_c0_g1_i1:48-1499(-)
MSESWCEVLKLEFQGGLARLIRCFRDAVPYVVVGVIFGTLPTSLLVNFCASGLVEVSTWDASLLAASWSYNDVLHMDTTYALAWILWSALTYSLTIVPGVCLAYAWREGEAFSTCCSAFFIFCAWATTFFCALIPGVLVLARAVSVHGSPLMVQMLAMYALCQLCISTMLPAYCFIIRPPGTSMRQLGVILLMFLHIFVVVTGGIQLVLLYWTVPTAELRLSIMLALVALRGYSEAVALRLVLRWPETDPKKIKQVALVVTSHVGALFQTSCYFLQVGTDSHWLSLWANFVMAGAELGRNICCLRGISPMDWLLDYMWKFWNYCQKKGNRKVFSEIVPRTSSSLSVWRAPVELASLYPTIVPALNYAEIVVLLLVYSLNLVAKLRPDKVGGEPQALSDVSIRLVIAACFEAVTDFVTVLWARRTGKIDHLVLDGISKRCCLMTQVSASIAASAFLLNFQCPQANDMGKLKSVSLCASRTTLFG